jgi:hypothetical protein
MTEGMATQRTSRQIPTLDRARISSVIARFKCSPIEESFFREGERLALDPEPLTAADLDADPAPRPSLWEAVRGWLRRALPAPRRYRDPAGSRSSSRNAK